MIYSALYTKLIFGRIPNPFLKFKLPFAVLAKALEAQKQNTNCFVKPGKQPNLSFVKFLQKCVTKFQFDRRKESRKYLWESFYLFFFQLSTRQSRGREVDNRGNCCTQGRKQTHQKHNLNMKKSQHLKNKKS